MDYYIGPNGELYHGLFGKGKGKPRDDHKYIKREWKNGRWQYTYKQDAKKDVKPIFKRDKVPQTAQIGSIRDKTKMPNFKKSVKAKKEDTNDWLSSTTTISNAVTGEVISETHKRGKIDRAIDKAKDALGKYAEGRKTDWAESKERADKKAEESAKVKGAELNNTDKWGSSTTTISGTSAINSGSGGKIYSWSKTIENRGKFEQYIDTAKEYVKDRLGFDEKAAYDDAKSQKNLTEFRKIVAQNNITTNAKLDNSLADKVILEAARDVAKYDEQLKRDAEQVDSTRKKYAKTIAGKVELMLEELMGRGR